MPVDASLYSESAFPIKSVADYQLQDLQLKRNRLALQGDQQKYDEAAAQAAERSSLRNALQTGLDPTTPEGRNRLYQVAPTMAPSILKTMQDQMTSQAKANLDNAQAGHAGAQTAQITQANAVKSRQDAYAEAAALNTPEDAIAALNRAVTAGKVPMQAVPGLVQMVKTDPLWKLKLMQGALDPEKLKEALMPHFQNAGGAMVNTNPLAGPVGQGQPNAIPITESADAQLQARTSRANNRDTQAGEDRRAAEGRKVQLLTHGLSADGSPSADTAALVDQIGKYQIKPPSGFALNNPRMQNVMAQVAAKYPEFDATQFDQRQKAARDFGTGKQGQTAQSLNVAIDHLEALQQAADALKNNDTQVFNKIGNYIATQTGKPAPTNFEATKQIVADEVVKAVVGAGGSMHDREQAAKVISSAGSPAQLAGVIQQYTTLMGGQLHGLRQTYKRTTGYDDFDNKFLTDNTRSALERTKAGGGAAAMPAINARGWTLHTDASGNRAYVSPDGKQYEEVK